MSRRKFLYKLIGLGTIGLTGGCIALGNDNINDISVFNQSGTKSSIKIEVIHLGEVSTIISETISLDDDESKGYGNLLSRRGEYKIIVVSDGKDPREFEFRDTHEPLRGDTDGVMIRITETNIHFSEITF